MKNQIFLLLGLLLAAGSKSQNVGIGTNNPAQKLDVAGNIKAQIPVTTSAADTFLLITDTSGTFKKIPWSMMIVQQQPQPTTSDYPTDLFSFHYQIVGNGNQASGSLYMDSFYIPAFLTANMAFSLYSPLYGSQSRIISNDWPDVDGIGSLIIKNNRVYINMFNAGQFGANSELRVYQYTANNLSSGPSLLKFSGLIPAPSPSLQNPTMVSNGQFLYFNKNTGTTNNIYSFSKYSISNDTLYYISTVTLNPPPGYTQSTQIFAIAIDNQGNFYLLLDTTRKIIKFDSFGNFITSIQGSIASNVRGILNWNNKFYLTNDALGYFQRFIFH